MDRSLAPIPRPLRLPAASILGLAFAVAVLCPSRAQAQGVPIGEGFETGNSYQQMSDDYGRHPYIRGVIDGMLLAPLMIAQDGTLKAWFRPCVVGMQDAQVLAIVNRYHAAHPEDGKDPMHLIVFRAMRVACRATG